MPKGQRESSIECGPQRWRSKGILFLLVGRRESRRQPGLTLKAPKESDHRGQGHSGGSRNRNRDKMEKASADAEWNRNGLRSQTAATEGDHVLYPAPGLWLCWISSSWRVVLMLQVVEKTRANLHKAPAHA